MPTLYPSTLDSYTNPSWAGSLGGEWHSTIHANCYDSIEALEAKVWVNNSAVTSSLDYKVSNTASVSPWHKHNPSDIAQSGATIGQALLWNGSEYAPWTPAGGWNVTWPWASVDSEIALYSGTSGIAIKRMTGNGLVKSTSWIGSIATPWIDYAQAWAITWSGNTMSTNKVLGRSTAWTGAIEELSVSGSGNVVLATWATTTNQTLTTPTINVWSDANWDTYFRNSGTVNRLPIGSQDSFYLSDGSIPYWANPFVYTGSPVNASATADGSSVTTVSSTSYLVNNLTSAYFNGTRGGSGSIRLQRSVDNSTWSNVYEQSTAWSIDFPIFLQKGYYYRTQVQITVIGAGSSTSLKFIN